MLFFCGSPGALAADATLAHDFATYRPTIHINRIEPREAPVIDGDLSDSVWAKAVVLDELYQLEPATGQPGSEKTIVRIMYDENNLYFGIYAYDREPDKIIALTKTRDANIGNDDFIRIYLDPKLTRRDSYQIEISPLGTRTDAIGQNNATYIRDWSMLWTGKANRVADGWTAEVAIPFRSLSYNRDQAVWGFDFQRNVRRKAERIRWSSISAATTYTDISREGTMTGLANLQEGLASRSSSMAGSPTGTIGKASTGRRSPAPQARTPITASIRD